MKPEKQLYQWDVNQYLTGINPAAQYVDYTIGNEVIRIKADGTRCRIPDELLQTDDEKTCYERYQDGTFRAYSFTVLYAPKPPGYVYTAEERTTFEALVEKADSAIEEINRRADSGEFTPVKGVDYFTDSEKNEMVQSVSSGAVGEFREVVDSATADFNRNSSVKTNDYNTNAETKTAEFDSNTSEKLKAYNDNHTEKMTTYDTNATDKLSTYNSSAEQKLEAYNQNHTTKLTIYDTNDEQRTSDYNRNAEVKLEAYNQNAENKTAEFDANAAALQTEVDSAIGEIRKVAENAAKSEANALKYKTDAQLSSESAAESEANALKYKTDAQLSKESAATSENKAAESEANAKLYAEQAATVFSLAGDVSFTIGDDKGVTMIFTTN